MLTWERRFKDDAIHLYVRSEHANEQKTRALRPSGRLENPEL